MGEILVRNLDDSVIERLKARALNADKSLEQSVREILVAAAKPSRAEILAEMDRISEAIWASDARRHRSNSRRSRQPMKPIAELTLRGNTWDKS